MKNCPHNEIQFGSGDFYIFCHACHSSWAMISKDLTTIDPTEANQGLGSQQSGSKRVKIEDIK